MAIVALLAAVPIAQPNTDPQDETCGHPTATHVHTSRDFRPVAARAWSEKRWREKDPRTPAARQMMRHRRQCARNGATAKRMTVIVGKERREFKRYRKAQKAAEKSWCDPHPAPDGDGCWVIPAWCVYAESGGSWSSHNPSSPARGPYQLLGHGEPWPVTNRDQAMAHHRIARDLYQKGGLGPWEAC